jgi:hypothetical protein
MYHVYLPTHLLSQVRHIALVEAPAFEKFKFKRTSTLPTRQMRSGNSEVPEDFSIQCEVATITSPTV